ncbi:MAG: protein kinase domain-containing protein [Isosphaeraceae bacterium]
MTRTDEYDIASGTEPDSNTSLAGDFAQLRSRKRDVIARQEQGWKAGSPPSIVQLFELWPDDPATDPDAASLIAEDFLQRKRRGENPSIEEYQLAFPEHQDSCAGLIASRSMMTASVRPSRLLSLPSEGDELFGFRLRDQLGRGSFARVFLAEQANLAGRPVVLKISAIEGDEPQTLAQLQHTNIVPIYSVHEDHHAGLRAVCMPFFGGATLTSVLEQLRHNTRTPRQGSEFVKAILHVSTSATHRGQTPRPDQETHADPASPRGAEGQTPVALLRRGSFFQAAAWVIAQLADGLQHAHNRGILHRDIKPSNILISEDGQPLLLDFNLSQDQRLPAEPAAVGGTIAYMAPEHLRAMIGQATAATVDRRSDIYALGMVLGEMLIGDNPFGESAGYSVVTWQIEAIAEERSKGSPSARLHRPDIPWTLESILRKCLAPDPGKRYQQAEHLADDLRRFLDNRPLRYAPELSRIEQVRKYVRRHPRLASAAPVAAAALVAALLLGTMLVGLKQHLETARGRLSLATARERKQAHDEGTVKALCLINTAIDLVDNLSQGIDVCEQTLGLYDVPGKPGRDHPDWALFEPVERRRLAEDQRELLLLLAGASVRQARGRPEVVQQALGLLEHAEAIGGLPPTRALWEDRAHYLALLGKQEESQAARHRAEKTPARTARDHYLLATAWARKRTCDDYRRAIAELDQAITLNPRDYWSSVQRGVCELELGNTVAAAGDFGKCIGLWPDFAWGYFNRGCVLDREGKKAEAIDDYSAALARDPDLVPAYINRGLVLLERKQYSQALADFDRAAALGQDGAAVEAGRGKALEALGRFQEADAAFERALSRAETLDEPARLRILWHYAFAVSERLPDKAQRVFEAILKTSPRHPQALYGCAMLAAGQGRLAEAIHHFDVALEACPDYIEARRYRAVILARTGEWRRASEDINRCLLRDPQDGNTLYAAACVASLNSRQQPEPSTTGLAVEFLKRAQLRGEDISKARTDPDLSPIRQSPDFQRLLESLTASPPERSS